MEVTITFVDGTTVSAELNGTCFITDVKPEIPDDLSEVKVTGDWEITFIDAKLLECASVDGRYWFTFVETTEQEKMALEVTKQRADIDFIAIVSDIDLEEG